MEVTESPWCFAAVAVMECAWSVSLGCKISGPRKSSVILLLSRSQSLSAASTRSVPPHGLTQSMLTRRDGSSVLRAASQFLEILKTWLSTGSYFL